MGDKLDGKKGVELRVGGFGEAPAHMNHYAWASEETVVQVHGQGPFAITYVIRPTIQASSVGATDSSAKLSKALRHCVLLHAARLASPNHGSDAFASGP